MTTHPRHASRAARALTLAALAALSGCATDNRPGGDAAPAPAAPNAAREVKAARPPDEAAFEFVAVDFADARTGWIAGRDQEQSVSAVFRTTDGGATWAKQLELAGGLIEDIDFASRTQGWFATVDGLIYRSTDGGATWTPEPESGGAWVVQREAPPVVFQDPSLGGAAITGENVASIYFLNAQTGWAAGDAPAGKTLSALRGLVLGTTDGGATWTELRDGSGQPIPLAVNKVWFVDEREGWAAAGFIENDDEVDALFHTTDGGRSWTRSRTGTGQFHRSVLFVSRQAGWVVGLTFDKDTGNYGPSKILATADGGATWAPQLVLDTSLFDVTFVDARTGWAVGDFGAVFATSDGGVTWVQQTSFDVSRSARTEHPRAEVPKRPGAERATGPMRDALTEPRSYHALFFLDPSAGWAGASRAILRRRA